MSCEISSLPFDLDTRAPLVLQCGHTFCKTCITQIVRSNGCLQCPTDRKPDSRPEAQLPRNFALVDASKLDLEAAALLRGVNVGRQLWLDERDLDVTTRTLGASCRVVEGLYQNKPVAVKLIDLGDAPHSVTLQTLQRELNTVLAVSVECHHSCLYKGVTLKGNKLCLVMKKYDRNLAQMIDDEVAQGGLPLHKVLRYSIQVLTAIQELHDQCVVIVDLKPQNLLLNESLDEVVVADFGLSRIVNQIQGGFRPSTMMQGTPNYMPPELFGRADSSIDMWSWAATVIHMLTGRAPFAEQTLDKIFDQVVKNRQGPPVPAHLPPALKDLLAKCLSFEPINRPTAAAALQVLHHMSAEVRQQLEDLQQRYADIIKQLLLASKAQLVGSSHPENDWTISDWTLDNDMNDWSGLTWGEVGRLTEIKVSLISDDQYDEGTYQLPDGWSGFTDLQELYIHRTQSRRGAVLPTSWSALLKLRTLDLFSTMTGSLPKGWSSLTQLTRLKICMVYYEADDMLCGPLPSEWSVLSNLQHLEVAGGDGFSNNLSGGLPVAWSALTNLTHLKLSYNSLEGGLPQQWSALVKLQTLDLRANSLTGGLPGDWSALGNLRTLNLSSNMLTGKLPVAWRALSQLEELGVGHNYLCGQLLPELADCSSLRRLNLYGNEFEGSLPVAWTALTKLAYLDVRDNKLSGQLPVEWKDCQDLTYFG